MTRRMRPTRRIVVVIAALVLLGGAGLAMVAQQHTFAYRAEPFAFSHAGAELAGAQRR